MDMTKNGILRVVEEFLQKMSETKKTSDNTIQAYKRDLMKFADYCEKIGVDEINEVTVDVVSGFKDHLTNTGLSVTSSSRTLSAVRSMFCILVSDGYTDSNPAKEVHNDKAAKSKTNILSSKEIELLMAQPDLTDAKGIRDKAILELLYATGIKVSELISLNVEDLNIQIQFLRVGSEDKERFIPLYKLVLKSLQNYINSSRKVLLTSPNEKALFVNCDGERMTRQGLWKIIKLYAAKAKIKTDITPHTLRHSFAAHLLQNGADIHDIQEILGHSDISSTQRYAEFLKEKVKSGYIKFHPRA